MVVLRVVSREHRSAPTKLPASKLYKGVTKDSTVGIPQSVFRPHTRSTKPLVRPQSCAYSKSHTCTQ